MTAATQRQWQVAARPVGRPLEDGDFELAHVPVAAPAVGQVLVRTAYLGFDPAQKSWMENAASYMNPVEIGGVMPGSGAGVVVESQHPDFAAGEAVFGHLGWQELATVPGHLLYKAPPGVPLDAVLSVLGGTGRTAYLALMKVGKPAAPEISRVSPGRRVRWSGRSARSPAAG